MESGKHSSSIPIDKIVGRELEIKGSHGMQAHRYPEMLEMVVTGKLDPTRLVGKSISLDEGVLELANMNRFGGSGVTVIEAFS